MAAKIVPANRASCKEKKEIGKFWSLIILCLLLSLTYTHSYMNDHSVKENNPILNNFKTEKLKCYS